MDYRFSLIAALYLFASSAHAGYAQLRPPVGWSAGGTGVGGQFLGSAANASQYLGATVRTDAALSVGGRNVVVPAALRFAANAPQIASAVLFANPALRIGVGIAAWLAADYLWDEGMGAWRRLRDEATGDGGKLWRSQYYASDPSIGWRMSKADACQDGISYLNSLHPSEEHRTFTRVQDSDCFANRVFKIGDQWFDDGERSAGGLESKPMETEPCFPGWDLVDGRCRSPALTEPEFIDQVGSRPMPDSVPREIPLPLPIDLPVINPSPGTSPVPQPLFIPTGDPVRNPHYDPEAEPSPENRPYIQPGVRVVPSPTSSEPWRVDVQPVDRPVETSDPMTAPESETGPNDGDKPKEETPGLCDMYPDIAACQKMGDLDKVPVATRTVPLAINREEGFGPSEGTCPAPRQFTIMGKTMAFRWDLLCDFAQGVRPVIIGMAYLAAVLAFLGLSRKGS